MFPPCVCHLGVASCNNGRICSKCLYILVFEKYWIQMSIQWSAIINGFCFLAKFLVGLTAQIGSIFAPFFASHFGCDTQVRAGYSHDSQLHPRIWAQMNQFDFASHVCATDLFANFGLCKYILHNQLHFITPL